MLKTLLCPKKKDFYCFSNIWSYTRITMNISTTESFQLSLFPTLASQALPRWVAPNLVPWSWKNGGVPCGVGTPRRGMGSREHQLENRGLLALSFHLLDVFCMLLIAKTECKNLQLEVTLLGFLPLVITYALSYWVSPSFETPPCLGWSWKGKESWATDWMLRRIYNPCF